MISHLCLSGTVLATSGWDHHDMEVVGFRIHSANGASYVHHAGSGFPEPALCCSLDADGNFVGLGTPPDYAVTETHLVIRYPYLEDSENVPGNHFLIRVEDGQVTGSLTHAEFVKTLVASNGSLEWKTPETAADRWDRFWAIVMSCLFLLSLGLAAVTFKWFRGYLRRLDSENRHGRQAGV